MARGVHLQDLRKRRGKDLMTMTLISVSHVIGRGRKSTRIDLKLVRIGSMVDVKRRYLGVIRMVSCVYNLMKTYWPLDHMIRRSRYGILKPERSSGHYMVTIPAFERYNS